jgi:hypothetical protein
VIDFKKKAIELRMSFSPEVDCDKWEEAEQPQKFLRQFAAEVLRDAVSDTEMKTRIGLAACSWIWERASEIERGR